MISIFYSWILLNSHYKKIYSSSLVTIEITIISIVNSILVNSCWKKIERFHKKFSLYLRCQCSKLLKFFIRLSCFQILYIFYICLFFEKKKEFKLSQNVGVHMEWKQAQQDGKIFSFSVPGWLLKRTICLSGRPVYI